MGNVHTVLNRTLSLQVAGLIGGLGHYLGSLLDERRRFSGVAGVGQDVISLNKGTFVQKSRTTRKCRPTGTSTSLRFNFQMICVFSLCFKFSNVFVNCDSFLPLIEAEQAENESVLKERLANWSLNRLRQEGYCITDLSAYWLETTRFGRPVASFSLGPGIKLPEHRFE